MAENENLDDEYSILNIHKNKEDTDIEWKSYNQNTHKVIEELSSGLKNEQENIYKGDTNTNVFQKLKTDSFCIEEVHMIDLNDDTKISEYCSNNRSNENNCLPENKNIKIDPKIQNILKERLSNVLTPRANFKKVDIFPKDCIQENVQNTALNCKSNYGIRNNINSTIKDNSSVNIENIKRKLDDEITKNTKREKIILNETDNDILIEFNSKLENEVKLKKEIINLETLVRLQRLEIDMLRNRNLPTNESENLIKECKVNLENIRQEIKLHEKEFKEELNIEKRKNLSLLKEINLLKTTINNLLNKSK